MTVSRHLRALCLLLLLVSALSLITTAAADTGKRRQPHSPTVLWHAFPLEERADHKLGAALQGPKSARTASTARSGPATEANKTFPNSALIGVLAATVLAAAALLIVRRAEVSTLLTRTGPSEADRTTARINRVEGRPPQRVLKRRLRRIPLHRGGITGFKPAAVGGPAAEAHGKDVVARIAAAVGETDDRAQTAAADVGAATPRTESEIDPATTRGEGRAASDAETASARDARSETEHELSHQPHPDWVQPEQRQTINGGPPKPLERRHEYELIGNEERAQAPQPATRRRAFEPERSEPHSEAPRASVEACEIALWTGYMKKQFYAAPVGRAETLEAFAMSSYFRLRDDGVPTAAAHRALKGLIARLEHAGWEVVSEGPNWYQYRLERLRR
jgi:hypothetical protein